jgi:hypothetical protein
VRRLRSSVRSAGDLRMLRGEWHASHPISAGRIRQERGPELRPMGVGSVPPAGTERPIAADPWCRAAPSLPTGPVVYAKKRTDGQQTDPPTVIGPTTATHHRRTTSTASPLGLSPAGGPGKRCGRRPSGRTARRAP